MRSHRFFLTAESIDKELGNVRISERSLVSQIKTVLRLKRGDEIVVLDGQGGLFRCVLDGLAESEIQARIIAAGSANGDPSVFVKVALPLLKGGRFEWALQKLTELGAGLMMPVISKRSVVKSGSKAESKSRSHRTDELEPNKLSRWQAIVREAAEQCERATVPVVAEPVSFDQLIRQAITSPAAGEARLICAERMEAPLLGELLHRLKGGKSTPQNISVVVGPEGGFAPEEIELALKCGVHPVSLGPRILRSETAAILAVAQVIFVLGDLQAPVIP